MYENNRYKRLPGHSKNVNKKAVSTQICCVIITLLCFSIFILSSFVFNYLDTDMTADTMFSVKNYTFDYLRFTQQWPPSVCLSPDSQHCAIPNNTKFWTIHGIWPNTFNASRDPTFCNNTWHFNETAILPIESDLNIKWPDLEDGKVSKFFWKHEWETHGTCASILPSLDSILKYFSEGLKLRETFNLLQFLSKAGIEPSNTTLLELDLIENSLRKAAGKSTKVMCSFKKNNSTLEGKSIPLLSVVEICFDKTFVLIDCPDANSTNCPKNGILYLPI